MARRIVLAIPVPGAFFRKATDLEAIFRTSRTSRHFHDSRDSVTDHPKKAMLP
jgi:hypothetical protein